MDPLLYIGLLASLIEIANSFQRFGGMINTDNLIKTFTERSSVPNSPESRLNAEYRDIERVARTVVSMVHTADDFLERVHDCIKPYQDAIKDRSSRPVDIAEARGVAAVCVCQNIRLVRNDYGGRFPSEEFKELWEQFGC